MEFGPRYYRVRGRVLYKLSDVEVWEKKNIKRGR